MKYLFVSEDGEELIKDMPMADEHPEVVVENGKEYRRVYRVSFKVPEYFTKNELKFNDGKSPSGRKHIF